MTDLVTQSQRLYINAVECKIYRLYSNGVKLPEQHRQSQPRIGRLLYWPRVPHDEIRLTTFTAQLLELKSDALVIPPIDDATILRINERGLLLCGQEVIAGRGHKSRSEYFPQEWVCKPIIR